MTTKLVSNHHERFQRCVFNIDEFTEHFLSHSQNSPNTETCSVHILAMKSAVTSENTTG